MRALQDQSILRPLATPAGLFVPCRHPILRAQDPESHTLSTDSVQYFVYRFSAAFWAVSLQVECHEPRLSTC